MTRIPAARPAASPPARTRLAGVLLMATVLTAAGCGGSALDPREVRAATLALQGQGGTGDGSGPLAGGPVTVPGEDVATGAETPAPGSVSDGAGSGTTPSGSTTGGATSSAGGGVPQGNCSGFKNQRGITDTTITLGNASDVSGPIPGLFASAQQGARAYVAYFNASNPKGICGRKLVLQAEDSRTDAGADNQAYARLCETAFASIGSLAVFDGGGANTTQKCGLPDMRAFATQAQRNDCATCFGMQSIGSSSLTTAIFGYWRAKEPAATRKAALVYINAGAAVENANLQIAIGKKQGMNWIYTAAVDVSDFNYGPYVQQMKSKGVEFAYFIGAYQQSVRMAQAMQQADYRPKVNYFSPGVYDPAFIETGGSAVEGATFYVSFTPLEENQKELNLYKQWLAQISPSAKPSYYGIFGWSAGKLFVEKALALGGRLDAPSLIAALRSTKDWTGGGMHAPMAVGAKLPPSCQRFLTVRGGRFVPADAGRFTCTGITRR